MRDFLENDSISILEPCRNLRQFFGKAFNEKTVKNIMNIRYDLDKDRKRDTIEACKDLIDDYNRNNQDDDTKCLVDVLGQDDDDEREQKNEGEEVSRRQDITLDELDEQEDLNQNLLQKSNVDEEYKLEYIEEGYLFKKKPKQNNFLNNIMVNPVKGLVKNWDHRYIRLKKGFMYWYLNERSREAQNKLDLSKIDDVVPHQSKCYFILLLEGGKKYKFKSDTTL